MNEEQNKTQQQEDLASIQMKQEQASERAALAQAQESELAGLQQNNQQRYNDLSQIVSEAETRLGELKQKDEVAQKRSNAFRYIAGVGDTLSGLANLVGTAHGAANQQQTYNGGMVAQRAEQSRKERKLEMDKISGRLDEMRAREKELKTAGSLAEAELKAKQNREQLELKSKQAATRREEDWKRTQQKWKEEEAARTQANADRTFNQSVIQADRSHQLQQERFQAEQDKNNYPIITADGSTINVPKSYINTVNVGNLFGILPPEVQKGVVGKAYTEKSLDADGFEVEQTKYEPATLDQRMNAVIEYMNDPASDPEKVAAIKAELDNWGKAATTTPVVGAKTGRDWSNRADK